MSKTFNAIFLIFAASVLILHLFNNSFGQDIEVRIKISADSPASADITGKFVSRGPRKNPRNLSFLNEYAGASGLGERISNVELADRDGHPIANKGFVASEYVANADIVSWKYRVNLAPLSQQSAAAHLSWIKNDIGILMLDHLLPQSNGEKIAAKVKIDLPAGWTAFSAKQMTATGEYDVVDVEKTSFLIGSNLREKETWVNGTRLNLLISGEWQFSDDDASKLAAEIFADYVKIFGSASDRNFQIAIMKFPVNIATGNWEADTRGNTITITSSDMPFKSQSLQRLHEQLRHEMFHLWLPNGVNLSGNYDWFYEGFALYQSLKIGVAANRIRFDDYLDTLSRAYNIDNMQSGRNSLLEASKNRWSGSNTQVYARGMLVAFLCDLAMLEKSKGKLSVENLVRDIYQKYRGVSTRQDGNAAVLDAIRAHKELLPIVDHYVTGADKIDWRDVLVGAGIEAMTENSLTTLKVASKTGRRQKDLLDKLGYNNWRKLTVNNR